MPGPVAVNFVNETKLLVAPGMTGATGNIYTGLHEFQDMAFALHVLRPNDLFVDIGANVGSYTVLAASVGAKSISVEPIKIAFDHLMRNIHLNGISDRVDARNMASAPTEEVWSLLRDWIPLTTSSREIDKTDLPSARLKLTRLTT